MKFFGLSPSTAFSFSVLLTEYVIMSHMQQFHTKEMHLDQHTDFIPSKKFRLKIGILPVVPDFHYLVQRNFQRHHFTRLPTQPFCLRTKMGFASDERLFFAFYLKDASAMYKSMSKLLKFQMFLFQPWVILRIIL